MIDLLKRYWARALVVFVLAGAVTAAIFFGHASQQSHRLEPKMGSVVVSGATGKFERVDANGNVAPAGDTSGRAGYTNVVDSTSGIVAYGQVTITGGSTAAVLTVTSYTCGGGLMVRNLDASNNAYLGKDTSTTNSTGFLLRAGETWSADRSWDPSTGPYWYAPVTLTLSWLCNK